MTAFLCPRRPSTSRSEKTSRPRFTSKCHGRKPVALGARMRFILKISMRLSSSVQGELVMVKQKIIKNLDGEQL